LVSLYNDVAFLYSIFCFEDELTSQEKLMSQEEYAETDNLGTAITTLLPVLERFLQFDTPEQTSRQRATWSAQLEEPLPLVGAGAEAVLALLRDVVIPNGVRIGASGFSGWVATMPTTIPSAANFAAVIAGSAYQCVQAFNLLEAQSLHWLAELVRLPSTYQGLFTSGGSVANLVGLVLQW